MSKGKPISGCSRLAVGAAGIVVLMGALLLYSAYREFENMADHVRDRAACNNVRQILAALALHAAEHDGDFPKNHTSSNEVFRDLFTGGIFSADQEKLFGTNDSPFVPDNETGDAPGFPKALEPGENHWAFITGLHAGSPGIWPLVIENPISSEWPPTWNADAAGKPVKGRVSRTGTVIIGLRDGSVELHHLDSNRGSSVPLAPGPNDKTPFATMSPKTTVLDVEPERALARKSGASR